MAFVIFLAETIMQSKRREKITKSFSLLMMVFILGWSVTELFEETAGPELQATSEYVHLLVMVLFAAVITLRWRRAEEVGVSSETTK